MSEYLIEDNVSIPPFPPRMNKKGCVYPFDKLEVGQSFFVPDGNLKSMRSTANSANIRYRVPHEDGLTEINKKGNLVPIMIPTRKFEVREVEGGVRVWRTL